MTETAGTNIVRFDDDAEQSVLGAAMMAPKYWTKIRERVGAKTSIVRPIDGYSKRSKRPLPKA